MRQLPACAHVFGFDSLSAPLESGVGVLISVVALPKPTLMPASPNFLLLSTLLVLDMLPLLLRVCLRLRPKIELDCFARDDGRASPAPSIDVEV